MTNIGDLPKNQICPYCGYEVDDSYAEWEEGTTDVKCDSCGKSYFVTTHYKFLGFEIKKCCEECCIPIDECCCEEAEA